MEYPFFRGNDGRPELADEQLRITFRKENHLNDVVNDKSKFDDENNKSLLTNEERGMKEEIQDSPYSEERSKDLNLKDKYQLEELRQPGHR